VSVHAPVERPPPPPGSRVRVRGEEWAVEKCLPLPTGSHAVYLHGVSELVRHHHAIFLTSIDRDIECLKPEDTRLVADTSPGYRQTVLFLETLLRRMPPTTAHVTVGHRGALEVMPYQLVPAQKSLASLRPRILIADGTGLGKTVELGIILAELIKRGRGRRILVVAIRSMLAQLQRELWARFTIPLVRLDTEGLARVRARIPANRDPFGHFDRCIVSMDTLKNDGLYRSWLEQIRWDVIVVDECHNVANDRSQRGGLANLLAAQCDALILTSGTPHSGRAESFAHLMRMLDPTSVADPRKFTKEDVQHLFVRRFKKDLQAQARGQLAERDVAKHEVRASAEEEAALAALHALDLGGLGRKVARKDPLVRWSLVKAFLSSPEAALESLSHRIAVTGKALDQGEGPHPRAVDLRADVVRLAAAEVLVAAARDAGSGKLARLILELRTIGFDGSGKSPRVVIFSERLKTLDMLQAALTKTFRMNQDQLDQYTAGDTGSDADQRKIIESFGHADSRLRVLLCSDAASEGVNLHHQCHHLFQYDVPWSLIRLTQRNGRIDRFGQHHTCHLRYLVTRTRAPTADQRIVERLIEKQREVEEQLGDPGSLLGLYDADSEDSFLTRGVARGDAVEALLPAAPLPAGSAAASLGEDDLAGAAALVDGAVAVGETDLLALFAQVQKEQPKIPSREELIATPPSLFGNDHQLLVAALRHLEKNHDVVGPEPIRWIDDPANQAVEIHAPESFRRHREGYLPREAVPGRDEPYRLVMGPELVASKLRAAVDDEGRWPDWHLLWEQHPLMEWLLDALGSAYASGEAPLLRIPALGKDHALFLVQGVMFNHESEAVEARWLGMQVHGATIAAETLGLEQVMKRVGLPGAIVNSGKPVPGASALQRLVPAVVNEARDRVIAGRKEHVKKDLVKRARDETRRLQAWVARSLALIEAGQEKWTARGVRVPRHVEQRLSEEREHVSRVQRNHEELLRSLQATGEPCLRLAAVFAGQSG
jgi:ERCC4-related helicase